MEKPGMMVHTYNPRAWEVEAGGTGIQGYLAYFSSLNQFSGKQESQEVGVLEATAG